MNETQTAKYTPGPWTVENGPMHPHHVIRCSDGESIAYTVDHTMASASNAKLIAAAPELLEALKEAYKVLLRARGEVYNHDRENYEHCEKVIDLSFLVISKALGGSKTAVMF